MPETYPNPYTVDSPIGAALRNLSTVITRGPSEAQNILRAEQALRVRRENENTAALGDVFRRYGSPGFDRGAAMDMAIRAGVSPDHLGGYERYGAANTYGATDPRTTNAFVGAGGSYSGTASGFREGQQTERDKHAATLAETIRQFNSKPYEAIGPDGQPQVMTQQSAVGARPIMSETNVRGVRLDQNFGNVGQLPPAEQRILGAEGKNPPTPRNYVSGGQNYITADGITDLRSGQPLPQGGHLANAQGPAEAVGLRPNVQGDLQKQSIAHQKFTGLLDYTRSLAQKEGAQNNFGAPGFIKGMFQDGVIMADSISKGLGFNAPGEAINAVRQKALASGVDPGLLSGVFDPTLPKLHTASDLLVFAAAETLANQSGRNVTDKDVKLFKSITGDPRDWMSNPEKFLAKLDTMEQIAGINQGIVESQLRGNVPSAAQAQPGANPTPQQAPGAPQSDPLAQARDAIARGAPRDAVIQRLQQNGINPAGL
jgi:hypothetical protein